MKAFSKYKNKVVYHGVPRPRPGKQSATKAAPTPAIQPVQGLRFLPEREELFQVLAALAAGDQVAFAELTGMWMCAQPGSPLYRQISDFFKVNHLPLSPAAQPQEVLQSASVAAREFLKAVAAEAK